MYATAGLTLQTGTNEVLYWGSAGALAKLSGTRSLFYFDSAGQIQAIPLTANRILTSNATADLTQFSAGNRSLIFSNATGALTLLTPSTTTAYGPVIYQGGLPSLYNIDGVSSGNRAVYFDNAGAPQLQAYSAFNV